MCVGSYAMCLSLNLAIALNIISDNAVVVSKNVPAVKTTLRSNSVKFFFEMD